MRKRWSGMLGVEGGGADRSEVGVESVGNG